MQGRQEGKEEGIRWDGMGRECMGEKGKQREDKGRKEGRTERRERKEGM